jgi:hypothetical protein
MLLQEDEFFCSCCMRVSTIGDLKRSDSAKDSWTPHPWASCAAVGNWQSLSTSGSVERFALLLSRCIFLFLLMLVLMSIADVC